MKITSKTTLKKILELSGSERILSKHGVPCVSCPMASIEMAKLKIGDICKAYGINLKKLLEDINKKRP